MCNKFTKETAVLPRNIHMLEEGKTAIPVTGQQHTTVYGWSQHQRRLLGFPFMPSASHLLIFFFFFYKTRECATRNHAACSSWVCPSLLWLAIKSLWHGLLTAMLHKPRHSKFRRKLLPFTARRRFVKSCKSLWLLEEEKKKQEAYLHTVTE